MILTHRNIEGIDIVSLAGRLVMADVPEVRQKLLAAVEQGSGKHFSLTVTLLEE